VLQVLEERVQGRTLVILTQERGYGDDPYDTACGSDTFELPI
jgi:hypothetical protein